MNSILLTVVLYFGQLSLAVQPQAGVVTGRLVDAEGKPVAATRVAAAELPRAGSAPESSKVLVAITQTDSAGRYRLENIPPGHYYILAGLVDYPTYYPGVTTPEEARTVNVAAGKTVVDLDFSVNRPKSVKLRGRLDGPTAGSPVPVTLFSSAGTIMKTEASPAGIFEFADVPLGNYMVRVPGFASLNVAVDGKDLSIDLPPISAAPGARVSGRLVGTLIALPGTRTVTLTPLFSANAANISSLGGTFGAAPGTVQETFVANDGTFEFPAVPPGTYTLRSLPAVPGVSPRITVGTEDVRGLELRIPLQIQVAGHIVLEGKRFTGDAIIEANQGTFGMATSLRNDGTFWLRLSEGDNEIRVARLPEDIRVTSISYGDKNVTHAPVHINAETLSEELLVVLERANPGPFREIEKRNKRELAGINVSGTASVIDARGKAFPMMPADLAVTFKRPDGSGGSAAIRIDGTFGLPLPSELYIVSVSNVQAPYRVKSVVSGRTNLLKEPLEINTRETPAPIEVILEYKPTP